MQGKVIKSRFVVLLLLVFLVYSSTNIFMKLSSLQESFSGKAIYFCIVIFILCIYAILWQKILKKVALTTAFMYKSVTVIYSMFFATIFFNEQISINNILGAIFIVLGIILFGWES